MSDRGCRTDRSDALRNGTHQEEEGAMKRGIRVLAAFAAGLCLLAGGCGSKKTETVSVQSVAMLNGVAPEMNLEKYAGVVTSGTVTAVKREDGRKIASVSVKAGDQVTAGQLLFTYDVESTQNDLDRQMLELQQIQNTITAKTAEKQQLAADKKKAKADEQLDYTLKIQDADTDIREAQYNLGLKQKEINRTKALLTDLSVSAPVSGTVTSVGSTSSSGDGTDGDNSSDGDSSDDSGVEEAGTDSGTSSDGSSADGDSSDSDSSGSGSSTFIKIEESGVLRVKGMINEENLGDISKGTPMVVLSRTDDQKFWKGTVDSVNTKPSSNNNQNDYGDTDTMTQSSKYPFYVTLNDPTGLLIGQHVYLEQDVGQKDAAETTQIRLPADFIVDAASSTPVVWMEDDQGTLTTRGVKLGDYRESDNSYTIIFGITLDDYIAYPDSSLKSGMKCREQDVSEAGDTDSMTDSAAMYADSEYFDDAGNAFADSTGTEAGEAEEGGEVGETDDGAAAVIGGGTS